MQAAPISPFPPGLFSIFLTHPIDLMQIRAWKWYYINHIKTKRPKQAPTLTYKTDD